jgi:DHA3 family multidrug efflux protein-like MFS transporter
MKTFHQVLGNVLIATITNNFVWFALTFWVFLQTKSVLATSLTGGIYLVATALSGFWFGSIVDHNKKKRAMLLSSILTLSIFILSAILYRSVPESTFTSISNPTLWLFAVLLLMAIIAGNIRNIALPTIVTLLVPADSRDKANGLAGTIMGIAFAITSFASGLALAYIGMWGVLLVAIALTVATIIHLYFLQIPENDIVQEKSTPEKPQGIDIKGTIKVIAAVPGLFGLLFFNTFNNFLGGVFMSLMDAYGLSLVSVQVWGILWGVLSLGFILGGIYVARKGLGPNPVRTLFFVNYILWAVCIIFPLQPWIYLLAICMMVYMCLIPLIEASEQTVIQKVVPMERQGRVFGFAQSIEQSASPLTAFIIGPIAEYIFIPFMTTGSGVELIGGWYGVGQGRGIGLVFVLTGIVGLIVTTFAVRSQSYKLLSKKYREG